MYSNQQVHIAFSFSLLSFYLDRHSHITTYPPPPQRISFPLACSDFFCLKRNSVFTYEER